MKSAKLDHKFGELRWRIYVFAAIFISAIGLLSYNIFVKETEGLLGGTFLILTVAAFILFSIQGVEVDPKKKQYKYYLQVFFLKIGSWKSYTAYTDIILLMYKGSRARPMDSGKEVLGGGQVAYEVYLSQPTHFDMILIKKEKSKAEGEKAANYLANHLGLPWVQYNPGGRRARQILGGKPME